MQLKTNSEIDCIQTLQLSIHKVLNRNIVVGAKQYITEWLSEHDNKGLTYTDH